MSSQDRVQGRMWSLILWKDDRTYNECQAIISKAIDKLSTNHYLFYAYILHDEDKYVAEDYISYCNKKGKEPLWKVGDDKPIHYHIFLELKEPDKIDLSFIFNSFESNIEKNYILRINNDTMYIRYLIHADHPDKFQYNENTICTNIDHIDNYFIYNDYTSNIKYNFVKMLLEFVNNYTDFMGVKCKPLFKDVAKWCVENDFYDMLLKYSYFIHCLID